jgi:hypothetical protein
MACPLPLPRWLIVLLFVAAPGWAADGLPLLQPLAGAGPAPPPGWHVAGLPNQRKPFTRFVLDEVEGLQAVRIEADESYGNLVHPLPVMAPAHTLAWQWRIDQHNELTDLTQRAGDDSPAKVCVLFDLPIDAVPFFERQVLRVMRGRSAEPIPAATVCYVWDAKLATGTTLANAFTRRIRCIVLEGKGAPLHQWLHEKRDVRADFLRLFGDETHEVPPLLGVALGADADNTHAHSVAHVAGLVLEP